jgi:hypothetical protein
MCKYRLALKIKTAQASRRGPAALAVSTVLTTPVNTRLQAVYDILQEVSTGLSYRWISRLGEAV